jgi:hypothetical protein
MDSDMLQKNKKVVGMNLSSFSGILPSIIGKEDQFFVIYISDIIGRDGLVISYLTDQDGGYNSIFLDNPDALDNHSELIHEIKVKFIVK